jgi:hypothetical protein
MGIVVNPSADKTRPIIRLVGLIASVLAFAFVWSGDQKVQAEIAATRAKHRPVYAGPAVLQVRPMSPILKTSSVAATPSRLPAGEYLLTDDRGQIGRLIVGPQSGSLPVSRQLTISTTRGELRLKPVQTVTASSWVYR